MKKLIATAVVAAATYGAFAIETGVGFEKLGRGATSVEVLNTTTGNYWSEAEGAANAYSVSDFTAGEHAGYAHPDAFANAPVSSTNALSIKTTFGKPLSFAVNEGGTAQPIGDGIYFDSLIKFTVCEEAPEANLYGDAKIALWLQEEYDEEDNIIGTNLMVRAGYLKMGQNGAVEVEAKDYKAANVLPAGFADKWHRVTIRAISNITADADALVVPAFAIYIDGNDGSVIQVATDEAGKALDETFTAELSEVARGMAAKYCIFPSLNQDSDQLEFGTITEAKFDGTGSVNELVFTATTPAFINDDEYLDTKFTYTYKEGGVDKIKEFKTIDQLVAYIADFDKGEYTIALAQNISIDSTITIANANGAEIILDLNGCTIENSNGYAITVGKTTWLTIVDSSVSKSGKISSNFNPGGAVYVENEAQLTLLAGIMDGAIDCQGIQNEGTDEEIAAGVAILKGGKVKYDSINPADGYKLSEEADVDGFYDILPLGSFTVTFVLGNGSDNVVIEDVLEGTKASALEGVPVPEQAGFTFNGWSPALDTTTITADTTFTAQWTIKTFTVTVASAGDNMTVRVTKNGEAVKYAESYTVNYGDDVSVVYKAEDGYELTGQATFTFEDIAENKEVTAPTATAIEYTISYDVEGVAATTYTVADLNKTIDLATATRPGYTFDGWTNETYKTAIKSLTITVLGNVEFYAKWTENAPATPVIPEGDTSVEVEVDISDNATPEEIDQILSEVVNSVKVAEPSVLETADQKAKYQNLFTKKADLVDGKVVVTAEIKETVKEDVAESAVKEVLESAADEPEMYVPRGLYYKITTMEDLDGTNSKTEKGVSSGAVKVDKPGKGKGKGFIKIQMGTQEYK